MKKTISRKPLALRHEVIRQLTLTEVPEVRGGGGDEIQVTTLTTSRVCTLRPAGPVAAFCA